MHCHRSGGSLRALQSLTEESILVSRAWVTALAEQMHSLLLQLFPPSRLQSLAHLAAIPETANSARVASEEGGSGSDKQVLQRLVSSDLKDLHALL